MFKQFYSLFGCNGQLPNFTVRAKFCDVSRFPNHSTCVIPVHRILQVPTRGWNKAVKSKKWILKSPGCTEHTGRRNVDGWIILPALDFRGFSISVPTARGLKCFTCVSVSLYAGKELVDVSKFASICLFAKPMLLQKIQQVFSLGNAVY